MSKNRLRFLIIAGIVTVIVIIISLIGNKVLNETTLKLSQPIAKNMQYVKMITTDKIYFYNSFGFSSFDIKTQTTAPMTPAYQLPNILEVHWAENGAVFKASGYGPTDQLRPILNRSGLSLQNVYWWHVDFETGRISLLNAGNSAIVEDAALSKDGTIAYFSTIPSDPDSDRVISLYSQVASQPAILLNDVDASRILWSDNKRLIYQDQGNKLGEYNLTNKTSRVIGGDASNLATVNPSGELALYTESQTAQGQDGVQDIGGALKRINISSGAVTNVSDEIVTSVSWNLAGEGFAAIAQSEDKPAFGLISDASNKVDTLRFDYVGTSDAPRDLKLNGYSDGRMVLSSLDNTAYIAQDVLPQLKAAASVALKQPVINGLDRLTTIGLTTPQANDLKYAINQYSQSISFTGDATIDTSSIVKDPVDPNSPINIAGVKFNLSFDSSNTKAYIRYYDLTTLELILQNTTDGQTIFNSGPINLTAG